MWCLCPDDWPLYWTLWKGTSRNKGTLNSEEINPLAIAIIEFYLSEGIIVSSSFKKFVKLEILKSHVMLWKGLWYLKTILSLALPKQYCLDVHKVNIEVVFGARNP